MYTEQDEIIVEKGWYLDYFYAKKRMSDKAIKAKQAEYDALIAEYFNVSLEKAHEMQGSACRYADMIYG